MSCGRPLTSSPKSASLPSRADQHLPVPHYMDCSLPSEIDKDMTSLLHSSSWKQIEISKSPDKENCHDVRPSSVCTPTKVQGTARTGLIIPPLNSPDCRQAKRHHLFSTKPDKTPETKHRHVLSDMNNDSIDDCLPFYQGTISTVRKRPSLTGTTQGCKNKSSNNNNINNKRTVDQNVRSPRSPTKRACSSLSMSTRRPHSNKGESCHSKENANTEVNLKLNLAEKKQERTMRPPSTVNTARLKPLQEKTSKAFITILENGWVCTEFFKKSDSPDLYQDVLMISPDGQEVIVMEQLRIKSSHQFAETVPRKSTKGAMRFHHHTLPEKYHRKYQYVARFINLVRSKTPKLTLYTDEAKCVLMENGPDPNADIKFYNGDRVLITQAGIQVTERGEPCVNLSRDAEHVPTLSAKLRHLVEYAAECRRTCLSLELVLETTNSSLTKASCFPVTMGRRPQLSSVSKSPDFEESCSTPRSDRTDKSSSKDTQSCNEGLRWSSAGSSLGSSPVRDVHTPRLGRTSSLKDFQLSPAYRSTADHQSTEHDVAKFVRSGLLTVSDKHFIENVGWASMDPHGDITIQFTDGCDMKVQRSQLSVVFIGLDGRSHTYTKGDTVPKAVQDRLAMLPDILLKLENLRS